ncbi:MAG: hypothetical protein HQ541_00335 [Mariniphaga sp.]|nr:hypothetical protein [Mariniphaga sp.]
MSNMLARLETFHPYIVTDFLDTGESMAIPGRIDNTIVISFLYYLYGKFSNLVLLIVYR